MACFYRVMVRWCETGINSVIIEIIFGLVTCSCKKVNVMAQERHGGISGQDLKIDVLASPRSKTGVMA